MKCPKCNGDKGQWDIGNYHWFPCDSCHETGEMIGNSEQLKSRSVQRREALQKGEPMPEFDKPEMPERIWAKDFPEAKQPTGKMGGWVEWTDTTQTEYLRADKVRELVDEFEKYIELLCNDLNETVSLAAHHGWKSTKFEAGKEARERIAKTQTALFPEGV